MTPKEIYEGLVNIRTEYSLSYAILKERAALFKRGRDSTEDDP